jgi:hypothetical protein
MCNQGCLNSAGLCFRRQPESVAPSQLPEPESCGGAGTASRWGRTRGRLEVRIIEARNLTFGSGVLNKFHTLVR